MSSERKIHYQNIDELLEDVQSSSLLVEDVESFLADVSESASHVGEARMSVPYAQLVHREINSKEYVRQLRQSEELRQPCDAARHSDLQLRASTPLDRQLELQARKSELFEAYFSAQHAAYEAHKQHGRTTLRQGLELLFFGITAILPLIVIVTGHAGSIRLGRFLPWNGALVAVAGAILAASVLAWVISRKDAGSVPLAQE